MFTTTAKKFDEIECPKCGHPIPVSEALRHQLTEELKEQIDQKEMDFSIREKELKDKEAKIKELEKDVTKRVENELSAAVASREKELNDREAQLFTAERSIDKRIKDIVDQERVKLEVAAKKSAEESMSVEIQDTRSQLQETKEKLKLAEKTELDLRKRERDLEEARQNIELETARRLSSLKAEVEESVSKKFADEHRLKDYEKEKIIQDLKV